MEPRTLALLEYPRVLARLCSLAASEPGRAAAASLVPAQDPDQAARLREKTLEAVCLAGEIALAVPDFPSLDGLLSFLAERSDPLDLDALVAAREVLRLGASVKTRLVPDHDRARLGERFPLITCAAKAAVVPGQSAKALARCLTNDGAIADEASPELYSIRQEIRSIHQKCLRHARDFLTREGMLDYLQDDFITVSSDRYVLPLRTNFKGRVQGVIHDYSQTGETCYFEPLFLIELNNSLRRLKNEERAAEARVLEYLTGLLRREQGELAGVYAFLVDMDVLAAKAALGAAYAGKMMRSAPGAPLYLKDARHPLLALKGTARPVTLELDEEQRGLIISGANAGGKTVCLKTLGLLALMTQAGLPVPADAGGSLPFFRDVFVFIGDEQSLEGHLSTFTAQIKGLARLWPKAGADALVLLDEFGAGTDPAQGAALAQAVVDGLLARGAYLAAATHFPGLKAYALTAPGVRAASMLFDPASKKPLYRIVYDQVGASNALEVAREHGLPEEILAKASGYLLLDGADSAKVFERLNALALAKEKAVAELGRERAALRDKTKKLAERFAKDKDELLAALKRQAQDILRRHAEEKIGRKQALKELGQVRASLARQAERLGGEEEQKAPEALDFAAVAPGDRLLLPAFAKTGQVVDKDERKGKIKVELGGLTLWIDPSEARAATTGPAPAPRAAVPAASGGAAASFCLDIRGERAEAAISRLEVFLDQAILQGFSELEIIHGKGTGALRREVHEYLRGSPVVASYQSAGADQGGDGATLVVLK